MKLLIVGAGAQAAYALETFRLTGEHEVVAILDLHPQGRMVGSEVLGVPVEGALDRLDKDYAARFQGALVTCSSNSQKQTIARRVAQLGLPLASAIHPTAVIAGSATIGDGSIVNALAVVQPRATVGRGVMLHAGTIVEHDCVVEDYANLAPRATLAGHVRVGIGAYVYTGASVLPQVRIGARARVGAGAVVLRDVAKGATVVGVPAAPVASTGPERGAD